MGAITKRVAIVTGGSKGIGAATAIYLAGQGFRVTIASRNRGDDSLSVKAKIEDMGSRCLDLYGDVSDQKFCKEVIDETVETFSRLDAIVHSAGGGNPGSILDTDTISESWHKAFDVHVHSAFHLARYAVPHMKELGGAMVFIASTAALRGLPNGVPYSTAKGALYQFSRALATDLAEYNIRVNTVSPGMIETDFHKGLSKEKRDYNVNVRIPLKRAGTTDEVAQVISLLINNGYITGENITVDGGLTMQVR